MTIKVFTDASSRYKAILQEVEGTGRFRSVHPSAVGVVLTQEGRVIGSLSQQVGVLDSNHAEFVAMYRACLYLKSKGIKKVDFYADCMNLVLMINQGVIVGDQEVRDLSYKIKFELRAFDHFTVTYIPRRENKLAHSQASLAFRAVE